MISLHRESEIKKYARGECKREWLITRDKIQPNYIICAANIRHWGASVWNMIEKKYTNTAFERLCFWTEYAANKIDEQLVKRPTVEAIVKYIA